MELLPAWVFRRVSLLFIYNVLLYELKIRIVLLTQKLRKGNRIRVRTTKGTSTMKLTTLLRMLPQGQDPKGQLWELAVINHVDNGWATAMTIDGLEITLVRDAYREPRFDSHVRKDGVALAPPSKVERPQLHHSVLVLVPDSEDDAVTATIWMPVRYSMDFVSGIRDHGMVRVMDGDKCLWIGFGNKLPERFNGQEETYDLEEGWPKPVSSAGFGSLDRVFTVVKDSSSLPKGPDSLRVVAIGEGRQGGAKATSNSAGVSYRDKRSRPRLSDVGK